MQEVGIDLQVLDDLEIRLSGTWHRHASIHHDPRGIRVARLSPHAITDPEDFVKFPDPPLKPVQSDDETGAADEMGRGAVAITVTSDEGHPVRMVTPT